jgi:hypothetical protein
VERNKDGLAERHAENWEFELTRRADDGLPEAEEEGAFVYRNSRGFDKGNGK